MPARSMDLPSAITLAAEEAPETAWTLPPWALLLLVAGGIALLLLLVIKAKLHAFVALLVVSVAVAAVAGAVLGPHPRGEQQLVARRRDQGSGRGPAGQVDVAGQQRPAGELHPDVADAGDQIRP